jgi:hypothetical protein
LATDRRGAPLAGLDQKGGAGALGSLKALAAVHAPAAWPRSRTIDGRAELGRATLERPAQHFGTQSSCIE